MGIPDSPLLHCSTKSMYSPPVSPNATLRVLRPVDLAHALLTLNCTTSTNIMNYFHINILIFTKVIRHFLLYFSITQIPSKYSIFHLDGYHEKSWLMVMTISAGVGLFMVSKHFLCLLRYLNIVAVTFIFDYISTRVNFKCSNVY